MAATLYRNGRVYSPAAPTATALLVDGDTIAWLGEDSGCPTDPDRTVDLDGALLTPAFVDAHAHVTDTGLTLIALDLSTARSGAELLEALAKAAAAAPRGAVVIGQGWDESTWTDPALPHRTEVDRAAAGRPAYLAQASGHSALCSTPLLEATPGVATLNGYATNPWDAWHKRDAHDALRRTAFAALGPDLRARAQRAALRRAASLGIACVQECGGPATSGTDDFTALLALAGDATDLPEVIGYWGELGGAATAVQLGAAGAAGDLYADGALGSQDAHLSRPYADTGERGHGFLTALQVCEHLIDCTRARIQGGFHAIGDAAIATVLDGFAAAAAQIGLDRLRDARHRIEHAEILDRGLIARLVEYGVHASVQPAFDRLWGGAGQMYETRLGLERSLASNPLGSLFTVGVPLAFGSDSPVTPLDPWGTVRAAVRHHNPVQRLTVRAAFAAHTRGGWRAAHRDDEGVLAPGAPATFAVWSAAGDLADGLPTLPAGTALPRCLTTVRNGTTLYDHTGESGPSDDGTGDD
jgi:predicted amidohydrolase YtcJ